MVVDIYDSRAVYRAESKRAGRSRHQLSVADFIAHKPADEKSISLWSLTFMKLVRTSESRSAQLALYADLIYQIF